MKNKYFKIIILVLFVFCLATKLNGQDRGSVFGRVIDISTNQPLPFATVNLQNTTIGVTTDSYGDYVINNLPQGEQILIFKFIGFKEQSITVNVKPNEKVKLDVSMDLDYTSIEEVVVTGQALGQAAAINQQIKANTIVNIVSQDKIRELPDQNAAETVGRLPGISVQRNAGEGQKIVVRGLAPRFNSVTVNGERMPSTDASDRSVDLSMLSPDVLGGIEVFKSLTPDKDADAVGGTVNFITKRAGNDPEAQATLQYGYNSQADEWGQLRGNLTLSKRFFNNKLGILVGGNYQKANRSQDQIGTAYTSTVVNNEFIFNPDNVNLTRRLEDRYRYGGSTVIDYEFSPGNRIILNSLLQYTDTEQDQYRTNYNGNSGRLEYRHQYIEESTQFWSNTVSGEHTLFDSWKVNWKASHSYTNRTMPFNHVMRFIEQGAVDSSEPGITAQTLVNKAYELHSLSNTLLFRVNSLGQNINTSNSNASVDLEIPLNLSNNFNGSLKLGGKIRIDDRMRDRSELFIVGMENANFNYSSFIEDDVYERNSSGNVLIGSFLTPLNQTNYDVSDIDFGVGSSDTLDGYHIDRNKAIDFYRKYHDRYAVFAQADLSDYESYDRITAGYAMGTLRFFDYVTVVGGARLENTFLRYTGAQGTAANVDEENPGSSFTDTTRSRSYMEIFPQLNIKIQPLRWFDIRLAATRTINRPDFFSLVPWKRMVVFDKIINQGNFDLAHTIAWNYDAFFSFYNNWGLLTVGGFYKELEGIDYDAEKRERIGQNNVFRLFEPGNVVGTSTVKGIEIDLQSNLRFLPFPFDGILLSANATFLESTTYYPFLEIRQQPYQELQIEREGNIIGQPDQIYNLSIGYEKGGFTGRASLLYQGSFLSGGIGTNPEFDDYDLSTTRIDVTFKQRINKNLKLYVNLNNLTNQRERSTQGDRIRNISEFGTTMDFGVQLLLSE